MKQSDMKFKENVAFGDMLAMANNFVESIYADPDMRLNRELGYEYLYLQAATRLFTDYGAMDGKDDVESFMQMVFSVGVERYENWLMDNAGAEKYRAFQRMVERGNRHYMDVKPLEMFINEAGKALHSLNAMMNEGGAMSPDKAVELLMQYVKEQEGDSLPQE